MKYATIVLALYVIYNNFCNKSFTIHFLDYKIVYTGKYIERTFFDPTFPNADLLNGWNKTKLSLNY